MENRNNEAADHFDTRLCDCATRAINQSFTTSESSVEVETKALSVLRIWSHTEHASALDLAMDHVIKDLVDIFQLPLLNGAHDLPV